MSIAPQKKPVATLTSNMTGKEGDQGSTVADTAHPMVHIPMKFSRFHLKGSMLNLRSFWRFLQIQVDASDLL